ncbi:mechanosensitive ion channel family protein [Shimia sagamensis]|uniref:MscS family membrane protein n=1 Tax=Shimia sagamensis TaxID=1566352 RepID=A0ABY1NI97_9RHOB|nr:mechanosensitive ion channel domain-containing protein [Shimia sagamensis]SMP10119.1 MscS family membrane protein [Shimia sagamensis]
MIINSVFLSEVASELGQWFNTSNRIEFAAAVLLALIVLTFRKPLATFLLKRLSRLMARLDVTLSDAVREQFTSATIILLAVLSIYIGLEATSLPQLIDQLVRQLCASVAIIAVFATWHSLCGTFVALLQGQSIAGVQTDRRWMERVAEFAVILVGIAALLKVWEVDVSGALTGVGVLGAAIAIAAQDLVRNLVAGMNNISEKRFSVGDAIEIEGVLKGTVEQIDLRSTTIRGFDQIPRYVPNSELSNAVVKNYGQVKNRLIFLSVNLVLSASQAQILQVRDGLRDHLNESGDFDVSEDAPVYVAVEGVSDHSVDIQFYARTNAPDYGGWLEAKERLTLRLLQLVETAGTELAYPTQTIVSTSKTSVTSN